MYMAAMCGTEHYVKHHIVEEELFSAHGVGPVKVVVLLRCAVMRHARGCVRPNPKVLFQLVQPILCDWMLQCTIYLPTLEECREEEASDLHAAAVAVKAETARDQCGFALQL